METYPQIIDSFKLFLVQSDSEKWASKSKISHKIVETLWALEEYANMYKRCSVTQVHWKRNIAT